MQLITTHTHTDFCSHAKDSIEDMVAAAETAGISVMAITEHYSLTTSIDPRCYVSMPFERIDEYIAEIDRVRRLHPNMCIMTGCELDWLGADEDRDLSDEDFDPYEIVLGSIHFVDAWPFDDPAQRHHWDDVGVDSVWERYFEVFCELAVADSPINVLSHPDLVKKFGFRPSYDPIKLYKRAVEAVASSGRAIELNTSGTYYACQEMFPAPAFLKEFCRAGVPCTLATDAHEVAHVARDIERGYRYLYDAGYREVTIPSRFSEPVTIPIEF